MTARRTGGASRKGNGAAGYSLTNQPGHLLRRCQQRAVDIFMEAVAPARITPQQFAILATLAGHSGPTQTELVAGTGIDRSTVGDMIDRLVRRGLVRRQKSGSDQRANALVILPAGRAMLRRVQPAVDRAQARIIAPVPPAQRENVLAALRLLAGIDDEAASENDRRNR